MFWFYSDDVWIGLKWNVPNQTFYWVNNASLDLGAYEYWDNSRDEPDCMDIRCPSWANQNCVRIRRLDWVWKTITCDIGYAVLCQRCLSKYKHTKSTSSTYCVFMSILLLSFWESSIQSLWPHKNKLFK